MSLPAWDNRLQVFVAADVIFNLRGTSGGHVQSSLHDEDFRNLLYPLPKPAETASEMFTSPILATMFILSLKTSQEGLEMLVSTSWGGDGLVKACLDD